MKYNNKYPKVNFIGNKEKLSSWICDYIPSDVEVVFDAFSGGASMSYSLKKRGYEVISNDILLTNYYLAKALVENNNIQLTPDDFNQVFLGQPIEGFMYNNYANKLFFSEECKKLDLYRENINKFTNVYKKALAFSLMRRAMVRKMPYSRFNIKWDKVRQLRDEEYSYKKYGRRRAYHNKSFKFHFLDNLKQYNEAVFDNKRQNRALHSDIFDLLESPEIKADLIYLDPPYIGTMNNYFSFYGALDEYIGGQRIKPFANSFTDKARAEELFDSLFSKLTSFKYWILSYNNTSYPDRDTMSKLILKYAKTVEIIEKNHNYQVTGKSKKNKNKEYLFLVRY